MSTLLQEVYDSFFAKVPDENFTYKANLVYQYLKTSHGYAYKTVPEDLSFILNIDAVLYVTSLATTNGNITLTINSVPYVVAVLTTDSLIGIANKINTAISGTYTVATDYSSTYPLLTITKSGATAITISFSDTGATSTVVNITQSYEGTYIDTLGNDSIELIALNMADQYLTGKLLSLEGLKQHMGTKDFDKIPSVKNSFDSTKASLEIIKDKIIMLRQEFNTYEN